MNKQQRLTHRIAVLALAGFLAPLPAFAQDNAKAAALAGEAIAAKESGDLVTAKAKFEELLKLNPADESAQSLLAEVNKGLLSGADGKSVSSLDKAAEANLNLFREVEAASIEASDLAAKGNPDGAIALLDQAALALPDNTAGQAQKDRLTLLRNSILASRDARSSGGTEVVVQSTISEKVRESKVGVTAGRRLITQGRALISSGNFADAAAALDKAESTLPVNETADAARSELKYARAKLFEARYSAAIGKRDITEARSAVEAYEASGADDVRAAKLRADFEEKQSDPHFKSISDVSPAFADREKKANEILAKARAQYLYGDYLGALESYKDVLQYQPYNTEAKALSIRIRETLHEKSGRYNPDITRGKLIEDIDAKWAMPEAFDKTTTVGPEPGQVDNPIVTKMKAIKLSQVTLRDMELDKAIETLGELSVAYDKDGKGVNFQLIDPDHKNPRVSLVLRDLPLNQVLEQVLRSVNYSYTVNDGGVVEIKASTALLDNETEFFSLSTLALTRMTGVNVSKTKPADSPFGESGAGAGGGGSAANDGLLRYFKSLGIEFSEEKGTGLSYDGVNQLAVTNSRRNLDRIRSILRRYSDVKQVNIESKFIDVTQGTLNQIAANWTVTNTTLGLNGVQQTQLTAATGNRTVASAFQANTAGNPGKIVSPDTPASNILDGNGNVIGVTPAVAGLSIDIPNNAPAVPGAANFGAQNNISVFNGLNGSTNPNFTGTFYSSWGIGGYDVGLYIQALEEATGSDLMAAPSLTVTNGEHATIKVIQNLLYPTDYTGATVTQPRNSGNNIYGGGSSASMGVTGAMPTAFDTKAIGVIMEVTPTVQDDNETIVLDLKPSITEFEGFVEYGGTSVAIAGGTVVTVPSGIYQPVFSERSVETKVTVYDGATVIIGGLTREQVQTIHDKVPVLGDLPLVGKLFQSNGKTSTKRNLMIFVTANLISPTGSPSRIAVGGVRNGTTFSNPTLPLPSGVVYRTPVEGNKAAKE